MTKDFRLANTEKVLVASAEQSFLYLYLKGFLPKGSYQSTTPCFHYDNFDDLHTKYFIKNELIKTDMTTIVDLDYVVECALGFYKSIFDKNVKRYPKEEIEGMLGMENPPELKVVETGESFLRNKKNGIHDGVLRSNTYDIVYGDVELGSYGIRECSFLRWIYGTGCAEPRTSNLMRQYGIS